MRIDRPFELGFKLCTYSKPFLFLPEELELEELELEDELEELELEEELEELEL